MKLLSLRFTHLALAIASLTTVVAAQAQTSGSMYGFNKGYVGLNAGQADYSLGNGSGLFGNNNRDTAYSITAGGYFNNNFGVEIGYIDFGRISRGGDKTRADGLNLSLVGKMPLSEAFNLLAKLGSTYGRTNVATLPGSGIQDGNENGWGVSYGIGGEYLMTANASVLLQFDGQEMKFVGGGRDRVAVTSVGLRYRF
jgi:OmpA-OmpF porin, OOP family